jgi:glutathione S-transferase
MAELTFFHNPISRGRIAHWMLEEVGVPYETNLLRFDRGEHKTPQYLAINPMGKIPTIKHRDTVITEAAAICAYLADAFPASQLAPPVDSPQRGTYYRWLFFGAGCIEPALVDHLFKRPPPDRPGALGYGSYASAPPMFISPRRSSGARCPRPSNLAHPSSSTPLAATSGPRTSAPRPKTKNI